MMEVVRLDPADSLRAEQCARLMAGSEPWITLGRTVEKAQAIFRDRDKEIHFVADDGGVAAFIILDMRGALSGYIQSLGVREDLRGRGLGADLVRWAEERIGRDSPNVFLCVSSFNLHAQRLYERLGYEVVGRLRGFIVPEHDEILLRKRFGSWNDFHGQADGVKEESP